MLVKLTLSSKQATALASILELAQVRHVDAGELGQLTLALAGPQPEVPQAARQVGAGGRLMAGWRLARRARSRLFLGQPIGSLVTQNHAGQPSRDNHDRYCKVVNPPEPARSAS